jgi:hypothetical protein
MYYAHADVYMIDRSVADIAPWQAIALSVALLVVGWIFYDQLCKRLGLEREKDARRDHDRSSSPPRRGDCRTCSAAARCTCRSAR